jgi:NADPH:quinone reductase-like Zn-dependent oxidoreductase
MGFSNWPIMGGFAQYTYLPEVNVIKIPDNLSFQDAAAISMVGMTSWHMLVTRANIQPGQTVLIMGGGSGMGIAGIQIAKLFNCDVIATAGTQEKMDKCLKLGADHVVNHREPNWYKKVRNLTSKTLMLQARDNTKELSRSNVNAARSLERTLRDAARTLDEQRTSHYTRDYTETEERDWRREKHF